MKQTPVLFEDIFDALNKLMAEKSYSNIFVLTDDNTHEHCFPILFSEMETEVPVEILEIESGEQSKNLDFMESVWQTFTDSNAGRNSLLINLGGGMITDFGGFAASVYKRGIDFVNVPTSLLAMTDAAIGGKTGLDFNGIKNLIGSFSFPVFTLIYPEFLRTLPEREFKSGLAEMLKHGLINKKRHWKDLIRLDSYNVETISELIKDSTLIKMDVVNRDPNEKGLRKILNFGHTIGHAVESEYLESEHPLLHGEAIAIGMLIESVLSYENELIGKEELNEIFYNILSIFPKHPLPQEIIPNLLEWMKNDKKNTAGKIGFSLLDGIGKCKYDIFLNENQIKEGIEFYNRRLEGF